MRTTINEVKMWSSGVGIEMFLGPLESKVIEYLWTQFPRPVISNAIFKYLRSSQEDLAINTINSTLARLCDKGLVIHNKMRPKEYLSTMSRDDFIQQSLSIIDGSLTREFPEQWQSIKNREGKHESVGATDTEQ